MRARVRTSLAVLLPAAFAACLPGGKLPPAAPAQVLGPASRGAGLEAIDKAKSGATLDGPFRIVFAGPEGEDVDTPQPQLVFSRPMRALGGKRDEPRLDARFEPPVEGRWEWVGSSAARFVPKSGFVEATAYTMELGAELVALDGSKLSAPVRIAFATQRPQASLSGGESVGSREAVELTFSQIVTKPELLAHLTVVDERGKILPIRLDPPGKIWSETVKISPKDRWPEGARLTVRIDEGTKGTVGNRPMKATALPFEIAGPLEVTSIGCGENEDGRCGYGSSLQIELNGPMRPSDLRRLLTIKPAVKLTRPSYADDAPSSYHYFDLEARPNVSYAVEIVPARGRPIQNQKQHAEELRQLKIGKKAELMFAPEESGVRLSFSGTYLLPGSGPENDELAVRADDTSKAKVGVLALDRDRVMQMLAAENDPRLWELPGAASKELPLRAKETDPPAWMSLSSLLPSKPGPVLFGARWTTPKSEPTLHSVLQRSELAMYTRSSSEGTLVWITSLRTGAPLANVEVEARDFFGRSVRGTTSTDGVVRLATEPFAELPPEETEPGVMISEHRRRSARAMVIFAQSGDDWIYHRESVPRSPSLKGSLFTDRGLYRPGETVTLKGMVRRPTTTGLVPVVDKDVDLEIRDPEGRVSHASARLGANGTWSHELVQSEQGALGRYGISASVDKMPTGSESFKLMEYRPSTFSVRASLDRRTYLRGDPIVCHASGSYLYGGSLAGTKIEGSFRRQHTSFSVPGLKGYVTQNLARTAIADSVQAGEAKILDASGTVAFTRRAVSDDQSGPELVICELLATDPSLDAVFATTSTVVHPASLYPAIEDLRRRTISPGEAITPKLLAVSPDGKRHDAKVQLELVERRRDPKRTWEASPPKTIATCTVGVGQAPGSCALVAPAGPYDQIYDFMLRAKVIDDQGRASVSTLTLYPGARPKIVPKIVTKPNPQAELRTDRDSYEVGEIAHLKASSPFAEGQMLLTIEREGILSHHVQAVTREPVGFDVKVDDATSPQLDAHAIFVSPFSDTTSRYRTMEAGARISSSITNHALRVSVEPAKSEASPGEEMDVEVEARHADGRPANAEITLYAADEATLSLANYVLPAPLDALFSYREHLVQSGHTRSDLAHLFDWKEELRNFALGKIGTIGHGAGTGSGQGFGSGHGRLGGSHIAKHPSDPRKNFKQSAFFYPSLQTDANGRVKQHVKLPDGVTTYRVMAFAITKPGDVGAAQTNVITSMPAQIRPIAPRAMRVGDRFVIAGMAANNGGTPLTCTTKLAVDGLAPLGAVEQPVTLAAGESKRLTFDVAARKVGPGTIGMSITCGDLSDAAEIPFEVKEPLVLETAAIHGATSGRVDEALGDLGAMRTDVGGVDITLSASPLAGLATGLEQLVKYPYGCTEQTTSRLVPLLSLRELAQALEVPLPDDLDAATREAVKKIEQNQQKDGGFGLWATSTGSSPWLTVYATWGLEEARRHHVPADDKTLDRARAKVQQILASAGDGAAERATAPFALDVMAGTVETGGADPGSLRVIADQLFDRRGELPYFSRALLLHAMAVLACDPARIDTLTKELASALQIDGSLARFVSRDAADAMFFDSGVRTSAIVLRALLAASPEHPLITPLALGLVADRRGGSWRTTQENAYALIALDAYRRTRGGGEGLAAGDVSLGGKSLLHHEFTRTPGAIPKDARTTISLASLAAAVTAGQNTPLQLTATGTDPLHYQAVLRFAPKELPKDEVMAGFEIHRRYYPLPRAVPGGGVVGDGWQGDRSAFVEGDLVLVELDVIVPSLRRFVVIDDPIPGGFENVNVELQGGPRWIRAYLHNAPTRTEHRDDRSVFFADSLAPGGYRFSHLVRATAAGTFVTPPARVEEMYVPETFGRTEARTISIK